MTNELSFNDFYRLFSSNNEFRKIEKYLKKFNPIKVMKSERYEIRHSAILAWLLDPNENHGCSDRFLKSFIEHTFRIFGNYKEVLEILISDFSSALVYTERFNIDILIVLPDQKIVIIVENKIDSIEHGSQLDIYESKVKSVFSSNFDEKNFKIYGVYLTLREAEPSNSLYVNILHEGVARNFLEILNDENYNLNDKVKDFILNYIEVIMELSNSSDEMNEMRSLAKKLYQEHRSVIDFIVNNGLDNVLSEALDLLKNSKNPRLSISAKDSDYILFRTSKNWFSFLPFKWCESFQNNKIFDQKDIRPWSGCEKWRTTLPICLWIELKTKIVKSKEEFSLVLVAEVGPLNNHEQRSSLINELSKCDGASFISSAQVEGKKYSRFLSIDSSLSSEVVNDPVELSKEIEKILSDFSKYIDPINDAIKRFVSNC